MNIINSNDKFNNSGDVTITNWYEAKWKYQFYS